MSGQVIGWLIGLLFVTIVAVGIGIWFLRMFFKRSSKEIAFVRTGFGGQKVVMNGGAFVFPVLHEVIPVNMNTLRLSVKRGREGALITRNRMRVDVAVDFYVRVRQSMESVADAAQTLGKRTLEPEKLTELIEGKFVDALRLVAAEMTLEDMHEKRGQYIKAVREAVAEDLDKNGLELETVSLSDLDQTNMEYFNPSNAFDAEGLTRLTEEIERRKKIRNDIEQDTLIQIRNKNLEAEQINLDIERETEYARLTQEKELEFRRAQQRAELARERADREREAEVAGILSHQEIEKARISSDKAIEEDRIARELEVEAKEIERRKTLEIAEQARIIEVAEQSQAESAAKLKADAARAKAVEAEEAVHTAREIRITERRKQVELILAALDVERDALRKKVAAQTEREAAADQAETRRIEAEGFNASEKIRSDAFRVRHEVEAEGMRLKAEADNILTPEARTSALRLKLVEKLDGIIRESVRPMEKIEGIKVLHVDGLGTPPGGGGGDSGDSSLTDRLVSSALRYRAQAPIVDQLLSEIGIDGGDPAKLERLLREITSNPKKEE